MTNDLRFAVRMVRANPLFSLAIIVTLALSIGVNTTVFTLVNAVLYKPVPLPNGARLAVITSQNITRTDGQMPVSYPDFQDFKKAAKSFESLEAVRYSAAILSEPANPPMRYRHARITPGLFEIVQTRPILGRSFTPADAEPSAQAVALISHSVWQTRYGSEQNVIGKVVRLNGQQTTIVGVMPEDFRFPSGQEVWTPLVGQESLLDRSNRELTLFAVLKPGESIESSGAEMAGLARQLATTYSSVNKDVSANVKTFHQAFNGGNIRTVFFLMLGAVACVLFIACANVANMMLSRGLKRQREITVRSALGASRWQLIRQLLIECVLLSCIGGALGLGVAQIGIHYFDLATATERPYWIGFGMDWVAFSYFALLSIASGILFGLMPALRTTRVDLTSHIRDGVRTSAGPAAGRITGSLVVVQFALTMVLLTGAGLLTRSFFAAQAMNPGVPASRIFTARVTLPAGKTEPYAERPARVRFYDELLRKTAAIPGATSVAISSNLPGTGSSTSIIELEDQPVQANSALGRRASMMLVSPGYHEVVGLRIQSGRGFQQLDGETNREAAIVSQQFANRYWPGQKAVGRRFRFIDNSKPGPWVQAIGVCDDIIQNTQPGEEHPVIYIPHRQEGWGGMALLIKTDTGSPSGLARPALAAAQSIDPDLPLFDVAVAEQAIHRQHWHLSVFGTVFGSFAVIGLLIASVGIYAVGAQAAASRTREIGIRVALGATPANILRAMLSRGVFQLSLGLALGAGAAVAATGFLAKILVLTSPRDPVVFFAVTALLASIGLFACWIPAQRASLLDPNVALRDE